MSLRILVTHPSAHPQFPARAMADLGIETTLIPAASEELFARVVEAPQSFDLVQPEYWMLPSLWPSGALQPIARGELEHYDEVRPLYKSGLVDGVATATAGVAPHTVQFVDPARRGFAAAPTEWLTLAPTICNSDTLGWRPDLTPGPVESWSVLLDRGLRGRVALSAIPAVGIVEAALACQGAGLMRYADIGDMSRGEIDSTIALLRQAKSAGQFHGFWTSYHDSVRWMAEEGVLVQSLWPPAATALRNRGMTISYDVLREGGRGWSGGFGLAAHLTGDRRRKALRYINWYMSGWAGAFLTRQGYSSAVPARARRHLSAGEWDYWEEGLPAREPILSPQGTEIARAGDCREGGSFARRMGSIACWSAAMTERDHLARQWAALIAA